MVELLGNVPLFALNAVAIDLETTGLDLATARIIEFGAVRIDHHGLHENAGFEALIDCKEALSPDLVRLTGITPDDLAGAPAFSTIYPDFQTFIDGKVLIGHSIGFDLAMLKRECALASLPWMMPRTLDTRLLASIVAPRLPDHSLETLASWLKLAPRPRHRAKSDAMIAAEIFVALLPKLREAGIRTLSEAESACRALSDQLERYARAGWVEPVAAPAQSDRERSLMRLDSYPYRHRIHEVMSAPPVLVAPDADLRAAMQVMAASRVSSVFIGAAGQSRDWGILTERDVLRILAREGEDAFAHMASRHASRPLLSVPAEAFVYRAIGRMARHNLRHLAVVDEAGAVIGALSSRSLLKLRASVAISLGDDVDQAEDVGALGRAWAKLASMAAGLLDEGIEAREIAAIIAREMGALTRKAGEMAERDMLAAGEGPPPRAYAILILGSAGRGESLLAMDQDNALVYAGDEDGSVDRWFEALGRRFTQILHEVGVPLCKGGVMASNAAFRASLAQWRRRIDGWVERANPQDLLNVDIFFDLRPVHGDGALGSALAQHAAETARGRVAFLKSLIDVHGPGESAFTLFGGLRLDQGRIDLKRHVLSKITATARVMALALGIRARATHARIVEIRAHDKGSDADLAHMDDAHARAMHLILRAQLADIRAGRAPVSRVAIEGLSSAEKTALKADLSVLANLDTMVRDWLVSALERP